MSAALPPRLKTILHFVCFDIHQGESHEDRGDDLGDNEHDLQNPAAKGALARFDVCVNIGIAQANHLARRPTSASPIGAG